MVHIKRYKYEGKVYIGICIENIVLCVGFVRGMEVSFKSVCFSLLI
jgi:hypothetical protein